MTAYCASVMLVNYHEPAWDKPTDRGIMCTRLY